MPDSLSASPEDYETSDAYAHAQAIMARHDHRDWAIGGTAPDEVRVATEYAIEPQPGGCSRAIDTELAGPIEDLPDFAAGARVITREVTYTPWRYVTPEEIEAEAQEWDT